MVMKQILAVALLIALVMTTVYAEIPEVIKESGYEQEVEFVTTIGVMKNYDDGQFNPDKEVKRGEFAESIVRLLGISQTEIKETKKKIITLDDVTDFVEIPAYSDVQTDNKYYFYVQIAKGLGIMNGYTDGTFGIDDTITNEQVIKALVSVLGYDVQALSRGGYPAGYLTVATEIGVLKGVDAPYKVSTKRGNLAKLIYNALNIDLMKQTTYGDEIEYSVIKDRTILTENLSIYNKRGQVTGTYLTRLFDSNSTAKKGEIEIDGTIYVVGNTNANDYLGYQVKYYYKEDDITAVKTLIAIYPEKNMNDKVEINYNDISSASLSKINYYSDKKTKNVEKADLAPALTIIFNGLAMLPSQYNADIFNLLNGKIKLLDSTNDGIYDIVFINTYVNYVVNAASAASSIIFDKYGQNSLNLNPLNRNITYSIIKDEKEIQVEDLNEYDVLTIYPSVVNKVNGLYQVIDMVNSKNYSIYVTNKSIEGKITEINDDEYLIGDKTYKISNSYLRGIMYSSVTARAFNINSEGTFYLDKDNFIAATKLKSGSSKNYAFMFDIAPKSAISSEVELKMLNSDNKVLKYLLASKVKVNGASVKANDVPTDPLVSASSADFAKRKMINYELDSQGRINELNTAVNNSANIATYIGYDEQNFSKDFSGSSVYRVGKMFSLKYLITDETVVFIKPVAGTTLKEDDEFIATKTSYFSYDNTYTVDIYDVNKDCTINAIVVTASNHVSASMNNNSIALIDKTSQVLDGDGQECTKLYFIRDGKEDQSVVSKDNSIIYKATDNWWSTSKSIKELKRGDIIQYSTDGSGKLDYLRVLFSPSTVVIPYYQRINSSATAASDPGVDMNTYPTIYGAYGKIMRVNSGLNVIFNAKDTTNNTYNRTIPLGGANYYLYNSLDNKISIVTSAELYEDSNVFVRINGTALKDLVIIK